MKIIIIVTFITFVLFFFIIIFKFKQESLEEEYERITIVKKNIKDKNDIDDVIVWELMEDIIKKKDPFFIRDPSFRKVPKIEKLKVSPWKSVKKRNNRNDWVWAANIIDLVTNKHEGFTPVDFDDIVHELSYMLKKKKHIDKKLSNKICKLLKSLYCKDLDKILDIKRANMCCDCKYTYNHSLNFF